MNELLQKHGCSNVFTVPEGLKELMSDITREVLRAQPQKICDFIADYLSALLITREHGILSLKLLDDFCDCKPSVSEHLLQLGIEPNEAETMAQMIKEEIDSLETVEGKEKINEIQMLKKILARKPLDEDVAAKVCQIARNAYRDYWYRKMLLQKQMQTKPEEPWEIAAQHTLEIYKRTKPSFSELTRATQMIQAAYRGYHVRRHLLQHLKKESKKTGPKVDLPGPPIDVASSREIDLGPVIDIKVNEMDTNTMFDAHTDEKLGLRYDPMKAITHVDDNEEVLAEERLEQSAAPARNVSTALDSEVGKIKSQRISVLAPLSRTSKMGPESGIGLSDMARQSRQTSLTSHKSVRATVEADVQEIGSDEETLEATEYGSEAQKIQEVVITRSAISSKEAEAGALAEAVEPSRGIETLASEVPEDIIVTYQTDVSEVATDPLPTPEAADATDVEDTAGDTAAEEEGE